MKQPAPWFFVWLCVSCLATGCVSVTSRHLVGDEPVKLDPKQWNGIWTDDDDTVFHLRVKDATKGVLEVGNVKLTDDEMTFEKKDLYLRQSGDWLWANFQDGHSTNYTFVRVSQPDRRHLIVWLPAPDAFVKKIHEGKLKGELLKDEHGKETGSAIIDGLNPDQIRLIESGAWNDAINLSQPGVLRRIGRQPKE